MVRDFERCDTQKRVIQTIKCYDTVPPLKTQLLLISAPRREKKKDVSNCSERLFHRCQSHVSGNCRARGHTWGNKNGSWGGQKIASTKTWQI